MEVTAHLQLIPGLNVAAISSDVPLSQGSQIRMFMLQSIFSNMEFLKMLNTLQVKHSMSVVNQSQSPA